MRTIREHKRVSSEHNLLIFDTHAYTQTHMYTHTCIHTDTHVHTHTYTQTHTSTHTYTQTEAHNSKNKTIKFDSCIHYYKKHEDY